MIVPMQRIRVLLPRPQLAPGLLALQDAGVVHPVAATVAVASAPAEPSASRHERRLQRLLAETAGTLAALAPWQARRTLPPRAATLPRRVHAARRVRRRVDSLGARHEALVGERELLARLRPLLAGFERLAAGAVAAGAKRLAGHLVLLRRDAAAALPELRHTLEGALGGGLALRCQALPGGETAVLLLVPAAAGPKLAELLAQARVEEVRLPAAYGEGLLAALPRLRRRRAELPEEIRRVETDLRRLAAGATGDLLALRRELHDRLAVLAVLPLLAETDRAVVVEGWVPTGARPRLEAALAERCGAGVAVEELATEPWQRVDAPVVLRNPRLFRPFEALVRPLPLPRYGTLDPTPFVAVFFPLFFGVMLGDLGYGSLLALVSWLVGRGAGRGGLRHDVARIGAACAGSTLLFGLLYGELFGDLGRRLGLVPRLLDREEAVVPFLLLALGLGLVHLLVGLVAAAFAALRGNPRHALGRGLEAALLTLVVAAVLAALEVLPAAVFAPAVVAVLLALPLLVLVEGVFAPVELLSTVGHLLSYARIMALGTASVMLAVIANRLAGAFGSAVAGGLLALLFHVVNLALGVFGPAIHALRLHWVELFGTCYSPGGVRYRPLAHWRPATR